VAKIGDTNKVGVMIRKMGSCTIGSECMALGFCRLVPPSSNQECVATVSGLSCPVSFQGVTPVETIPTALPSFSSRSGRLLVFVVVT